MSTVHTLENKIHSIPSEYFGEIDAFLDFLIQKSSKINSNHSKLTQSWAGSLKEINIDSVKLQKQSLEWR